MGSTARPIETGSGVHRQSGFTYLGLMLMVAAMGAALGATAQVWATIVQREKEVQLLFVGDEFRKALTAYARGARNPSERSPRTLDDLVKDPRHPDTRRYLRQVYVDPVTGKREWGLQKDTSGGIVGVFSLSEAKPLKMSGFSKKDEGFDGKTKYSEWIFLGGPEARTGFREGPGVAQPGVAQPGGGATAERDLRPVLEPASAEQLLKGATTGVGAGK